MLCVLLGVLATSCWTLATQRWGRAAMTSPSDTNLSMAMQKTTGHEKEWGKFHRRPVPIFEGNSFTANFNLVSCVHHLQYNQFLLTFQCQSTSQCQLMGWITSITISASSMVALVISIFLSILYCLARGQHRHVLLKSEWWPSSVEQLRLTTNRFEILATVKLTVVDINIPSTRKIGILSRNEFQTLCTFVNVTHFCIALLSNVVLVVVCVVVVVCKSRLKMAIASLLQD